MDTRLGMFGWKLSFESDRVKYLKEGPEVLPDVR